MSGNLRKFCILLVLSFSVLLISACTHTSDSENVFANRYSRLFCNGKGIVYNDSDGAICRLNTESRRIAVIVDNRELISACDAIVCRNGDKTEIYDNEGVPISVENLPALNYGEVHDGVLYYIRNDDKMLRSYAIESGEDTEVFGITTDAFCLSDGVLYCENGENVIKCDMTVGKSEPVFGGRYPFWFCADNGILYVSDYDDNSKVKMICEDGSVSDTGISSVRFCVKDDIIYYIPHVNDSDLLDIPESEQKRAVILCKVLTDVPD